MKFNKPSQILILIICILSTYIVSSQKSITIVPYPKYVQFEEGSFKLKEGMRIGFSSQKLASAADLLSADLYQLFEIKSKMF